MNQKDVGDNVNARLKDLQDRKKALQIENKKLKTQVGCMALGGF